MVSDFKAFINRGNVIELAVAVIIGAAFGRIVTSLTDDIIMPTIGRIFGGLDFSSYFLRLGPVPAGYTGSLSDYAALKKAGAPLLGYGQFLTVAVNFLLVAFVIFLVVRAISRALPKQDEAAVASPEAADLILLREIRDELRRRPAGATASIVAE